MNIYLGQQKYNLYIENNLVSPHINELFDVFEPVDYIQATDNAYIDLGFSFDTKARIHIDQYIFDNVNVAYPFGATENNGTLRCCLSSPYPSGDSRGTFYGSTGNNFVGCAPIIAAGAYGVKNTIIAVLEPGNITVTNTTVIDEQTSTKQGTYTMTNHLYLFAQNYNGNPRFGDGVKQIGKFQYYDKNDVLICSLIPCYRKSDNTAGMYDTVRKIFLTNIGNGKFIAGTEI